MTFCNHLPGVFCQYCFSITEAGEQAKVLTDDLLTACKDALHTLENTTTDEPDWARGTVALLREAIARAERER